MTAAQRKSLAGIVGGLFATGAMTLFGYIAVAAGLDVAMLGSRIRLGPSPSLGWLVMMAVHLLSGVVVFPLLYVFLIYPALAGPTWLRGIIWGILLWLGAQLVVMPLLGGGLFSTALRQPWFATIWSLAAHVLYGGLLGTIARPTLSNRIKEESVAQGGREAA